MWGWGKCGDFRAVTEINAPIGFCDFLDPNTILKIAFLICKSKAEDHFTTISESGTVHRSECKARFGIIRIFATGTEYQRNCQN